MIFRICTLVLFFAAFGCGGKDFETEDKDLYGSTAGGQTTLNTGGSPDDAGSATGGTGGSELPLTGGTGGITPPPAGGTAGAGGVLAAGGTPAVDAGACGPSSDRSVAQIIEDLGGPDCQTLVMQGLLGTCSDYPLTREKVVVLALDTTDASQFLGMNISPFSIYGDVGFGSRVDEAWWLGLIDRAPYFIPNDQANDCFARGVFERQANLRTTYAVSTNSSSNTAVDPGTQLLTQIFTVWGTSATDRLNFPVQVVNSLAGDFTSPEPQEALESIMLTCQDGTAPRQEYTQPVIGGVATFNGLDCWDSANDGIEVRIYINVAPLAPSGSAIQVGFNFETLDVRGGARDSAPTLTVP